MFHIKNTNTLIIKELEEMLLNFKTPENVL